MTINEERQKLEREINQTIREISSTRDEIERILLLVVLRDLREKEEELEMVNDFFDP